MKIKLLAASILFSFAACTEANRTAGIEGTYVRKAQKKFANITVYWEIHEINPKSQNFSIIQKSVIQPTGDTLKKSYEENEKFTAVFNPETTELYINERGISYQVNTSQGTISAPNEVYTQTGK